MCVRVDEAGQQTAAAQIGDFRTVSDQVPINAAAHADEHPIVDSDGVGGLGRMRLKHRCVGENVFGEHRPD